MKLQKKRNWSYVNKWYIIIPLLFLTIFFFIPLIKLFHLSIYDSNNLTFSSYLRFFESMFYIKVMGKTIWFGILSTIICIIMGYPIAYKIARMEGSLKTLAMATVIFPLWVSIIVRLFGWIIILDKISLTGEFWGVMIGLVHVGLPFMIHTLIGPLENLDRSLEDASYIFGATFFKTFFKVTLPLTLPGIISGAMLVFPLNTAAFIVPVLLGNGRVQVLTTLIYEQTVNLYDWSFAAVMSIILLITTLLIILILNTLSKKSQDSNIT